MRGTDRPQFRTTRLRSTVDEPACPALQWVYEFAPLRHPPRREGPLRSRDHGDAGRSLRGDYRRRHHWQHRHQGRHRRIRGRAESRHQRSETALRTEINKSEAALRAEIAEGRTEVANVWAELKTDIGLVRVETGTVEASIGGLEARLYRQLWLMAAGIVGLTVALVKLLG